MNKMRKSRPFLTRAVLTFTVDGLVPDFNTHAISGTQLSLAEFVNLSPDQQPPRDLT